jgi:hypothetical protein
MPSLYPYGGENPPIPVSAELRGYRKRALPLHARNVRLWWSALAATVAALETWAVLHPQHEATLSHLTRTAYRTNTHAGRVVFAASWAGFAIWFARHILRKVTP